MNLERIVGSIVKEQGPQPFVLNVQTGTFELGSFVDPDEAQAELNVIQQQRFAQLICERANVSFAQVRLGQYFCTRCKRWVNVTQEPWGDRLCPACSAEQAPAAPDEQVKKPDAPAEDEANMPGSAASNGSQQRLAPAEKSVESMADDEGETPVQEEATLDTSATPTAQPTAEQAATATFTVGELLEKAIMLAIEAHLGQVDKAGMPYILHPLRMMTRLDTPEAKMAAVLHDVVEDSAWTLEKLRMEGFPPEVLEAVDALTRYADETYEAFIERAAQHPLARRVKLADLEDNMDVRRLGTLTKRDVERLQRYQKAWRRLRQEEA